MSPAARPAPPSRFLVLLYRPKFASNVGTIIRSCSLLGASGLIVASDKPPAFRQRAEKVGMLTRHQYVLETKWIQPDAVHGVLSKMRALDWHLTAVEYETTGVVQEEPDSRFLPTTHLLRLPEQRSRGKKHEDRGRDEEKCVVEPEEAQARSPSGPAKHERAEFAMWSG